MAARRRRRRSLGAVKVCKIVRGKVKCHSAKKSSLSGVRRRRRRLGSTVLGRMPRRNSKGRFVRG